MLLLVRLRERATPGRLFALAAVCGLALTNHTSAAPVTLVLAVGALLVAPRLFRQPTTWTWSLLCGLAPLLLYAYLPWASQQQPYLDWGNPETWDGLVGHVTRSQYAAVEPDPIPGSEYGAYLRRLGILAGSMSEQFAIPHVLLVAVVGFYALVVRQPGLWVVLMAIGWLCSIGITQYSAYSFDREHTYANQIFFIPAWATLSWLVAGGLDTLLIGLRGAKPLLRSRPALLTAMLGCILVLLPAARNLPKADRSETTLVADYGRALLDGMGQGALYFPSSDHSTFSVMAWQGVHGHRTDVVLADRYGRIEQELVDAFVTAEDAARFKGLPGSEQRKHIERILLERWPGPVYFANRRDMTDTDRVLEPSGLLFEVMTPEQAEARWAWGEGGSQPPGLAVWDELAHLELDDPRESLDFTVQMIRGDIRYLRGLAELRSGLTDEAFDTWAAIEADLAPLKQLFNNIGSALAELGRRQDALRFYEQALDEDPHYVLALRNTAIVHREQGSVTAALEALDRLLVVTPDARRERLERARLRGLAERPLEALSDYEALARQDPQDPVPWREAGSLLAKFGDLQKAEEAYEQSLRLEPRQLAVAEELDRVRHQRTHDPPSLGALSVQDPLAGALDGHADHTWPDDAALLGVAAPRPPTPTMPGSQAGHVPGAPVLPDPTRSLIPDTSSPHAGGLP